MSYSVLRKFLSTTALFAVASTISACSGEVERFGSPAFGGFTSNQKEIFTASTGRPAGQPVYNQPMPAAVPVRPQATYRAPVYQAPVYNAPRAQVPTVQAPLTTGSIARQPVYNAAPVPVYAAPAQAAAPVYAAPVYNAPAQRVPVYQPPVQAMRPNADYLATGSIAKVKLDPKPVVISSFHALPKAAPRRRAGVDYAATAATRPAINQPMPARPIANRPSQPVYTQPNYGQGGYQQTAQVQPKRNFATVISNFFSLPKAAPRTKRGVDYGSTAAINKTVYSPNAGLPTRPASYGQGNRVASVAPVSLNKNQVQPRMSGRWSSVGGTMVQVRPGEDLNALSRRYGVPSKAIAEVNGLPDRSFIASGQQVLIPVYQQVPNYGAGSNGGAQRVASLSQAINVPSVIRTPKANPLRLQSRTPYGQRMIRMQQQANASQRHMVMPGDTLTGIARRYSVPLADLAAANKLSTSSPVRMGQQLHIPAIRNTGVDYTSTASIGSNPYHVNSGIASLTRLPSAKPRQLVKASLPVVRVEPTGPIRALPKRKMRVAAVQPRGIPAQTKPVMSDAQPQQVANRLPANNNGLVAAPSVSAGAPKFRWPVRGRIISNFGRKRDGGRNDGINLAVPAGTSVRVAEGGKVIYSGSKLKGYGNLVLVQHENGWVTAYAHNEKLLVSKGQMVRRGQIIAQAGKSGNVDSPQVHFELRIKGDPVDPVPYLVAS
ncbi:peptidoglycan DD-metalloendopeptidase family protein [Cohaesibacter gelatinilyticus]|uniref:Murein DD-endopeptidase MepM and murein hydrolase activator NlpD, contain LysM domain n=1 Tax=Cohaesibacter gelatinilyticus TaxID=372072 RepID=A0A285NE12_9HYPH|nr:peptidoglycan DD-metalloendopeptidase family protein [Cohaesibacter gelatinilyticus]SNZ07734.1 Murein DD-endopeptidase MepM and murein hydrolase activator NlpD, contain LysM domain [Cohaesibacter gelatinilyticus]